MKDQRSLTVDDQGRHQLRKA